MMMFDSKLCIYLNAREEKICQPMKNQLEQQFLRLYRVILRSLTEYIHDDV